MDAFWNATATISGGQINRIASDYVYASVDHIKIICQTHDYNTTTKILTGTWLDNSAFSIQLIDYATYYSPTIQNITFIPEPATMLLLAAGGLLLRRKRS